MRCCAAKCLKFVPLFCCLFWRERKGYLWVTVFLKRAFFNFVLGICNADAGLILIASEGERDDTGVSTLGSRARSFEYLCNVGDNTHGVGVSTLTESRTVSILFNCVANVSNALRTGPPASKLDEVVDGGFVRRVMISVAACFRKSTSLTCGNGTFDGGNVTLSQALTCFVRGK